MLPELLRVEDFCSRYAVSRASFYRLANRGEIKLFKIGSATRVKTVDAEAWFNTLKQGEVA